MFRLLVLKGECLHWGGAALPSCSPHLALPLEYGGSSLTGPKSCPVAIGAGEAGDQVIAEQPTDCRVLGVIQLRHASL